MAAPQAQQRLRDSCPPPLEFKHSGEFAFETLRTRMPVNLAKAIDYLHRHLGTVYSQVGARGRAQPTLPG